MNILIAGSKGFIGSHLVNHFKKENLVIGCDIRPDKDKQDKNFNLIQSISDYEIILGEKQFDLFINASGSAGVGFSIEYPEKDYELNTSNVEAMLLAVKNHSPQTKFINFSSAAVYGNLKHLPVKETDEVLPLSPYGKHKLEAEKILKKFHDQWGLKSCSLRIFSAYGPGLHKQLFWDIYQKSLQTKNITLYGTGAETRDFIFIYDLVRAIEIVSQKSKMEGEVINVASGNETNIRLASEKFVSFLGNNFSVQFNKEEKEGDPKNWVADITLLKSMGFVTSVSTDEGLQKVAQSYLSFSA